MSAIEKGRVKNAPLVFSEDRSDFVSWATSIPDGSVSAGWQSIHPHLAGDLSGQVLRTSGAKLVSLVRRELNQTPEEVAAAAGVQVLDVVALEQGGDVAGEIVTRIAGALRLNADVLVKLFGFTEVLDSQLVAAATEFVIYLERAEPLQPREVQALDKFRHAAQAG